MRRLANNSESRKWLPDEPIGQSRVFLTMVLRHDAIFASVGIADAPALPAMTVPCGCASTGLSYGTGKPVKGEPDFRRS
jgi:hypothetical protein